MRNSGEHVAIFVKRYSRRSFSNLDGNAFLHCFSGDERNKAPGQFRLAREPADRELPSAQRRSAGMSRKRRQRRHSDASRYFGLTAVIRDHSGIGPVAVKNRASFGEERQRFRLLVSE